jgi:hypothetical protein
MGKSDARYMSGTKNKLAVAKLEAANEAASQITISAVAMPKSRRCPRRLNPDGSKQANAISGKLRLYKGELNR